MQFLIDVRVRPNASRNKVGGTVGDPPRLVVAVQAPAVDGKANDAVLRELARAFDLRPRNFTIVFGGLGRDKRIAIDFDSGDIQNRYSELCASPSLP